MGVFREKNRNFAAATTKTHRMIHNYITRPSAFPITGQLPWSIIAQLDDTLRRLMASLGSDYDIHDGLPIELYEQ